MKAHGPIALPQTFCNFLKDINNFTFFVFSFHSKTEVVFTIVEKAKNRPQQEDLHEACLVLLFMLVTIYNGLYVLSCSFCLKNSVLVM